MSPARGVRVETRTRDEVGRLSVVLAKRIAVEVIVAKPGTTDALQ